MPTTAWIAAASDPRQAPIFVYQMPDIGVYFASDAGHYTVGFSGSNQPHHPSIIDKGGLPAIDRKIQNLFYGKTAVTIGQVRLIDDGTFDAYFSGYATTLRGQRLYGYITYPGLADGDAVLYLSARVKTFATDGSALTLSLGDAVAEEIGVTNIAAGAYTSATMGDVVKARLTSAGITYPSGYDTAKWNAWVAGGQPGAYVVTGQWGDGRAIDIVDRIIAETLSWYMIGRSGKFSIEQFTDLGTSPLVDIDLDDAASVYAGANKSRIYDPVYRAQIVKYNAGASSVSKLVNASVSAAAPAWYATALGGLAVDCGVTNVTDATTLAAARLNVLSAEHLITEVATDGRALGYDLGATVKLTLAGKKLPAITPIYHRIVGIKEDPNKGETFLTLWTLLGATPA